MLMNGSCTGGVRRLLLHKLALISRLHADGSVPPQNSTASSGRQCSLPDLNRESEDMPDRTPERMSEDLRYARKISRKKLEEMPERMSEDVPERMPEDMLERMSEDMPERMPGEMREGMSEDMPERMSGDIRRY